MANKVRLQVVTPTRRMFDKEVDMVILRTEEGEFGVLHGHIPITSILDYSVVRIIDEEQQTLIAVLGGFAEVTAERVTVMADMAEWPDEIDVARAEAAKIRAERILEQSVDAVDMRRAELALRRSMVRIEVSSYPLMKGNKGS